MEEKTLLIIDDDVKDAGMLADVLVGRGYPVHLAHTKDEALNLVIKIRPSLIFVKAVLMDASGYEIIRDIRKWDDFAETPFIIMAAVEKRYDDRSRLGYKNVHTMKTPINADDALRKTAELTGFGGVGPVGPGTAEGSEPGRVPDAGHDVVDEAEGGHISKERVSEAFPEKPSEEESAMSKEFNDSEIPGGQRDRADGYGDTVADGRHAGDGEEVFDAEIVEDDSATGHEEQDDAPHRPGLNDSRRNAMLVGAAAVFIVTIVAVVYFVFIKEKLSGGEPVKTQQAVTRAVPEANPAAKSETKPETGEDVTVVEARPAEKQESPAGRENDKIEGPEAVRVEPPPAVSKNKPLAVEAGKSESGSVEKHAAKPAETPPGDKPKDNKQPMVKKESVKAEPPPAEESQEAKEKPAARSSTKHAGVLEKKKSHAEEKPEKAKPEKAKADKSAAQESAVEKKTGQKADKNADSTPKKSESSSDASKPEDGYRLQAGYFSNPENAKKLAENLRKSGYDVSVEEVAGKNGETRHKVMVGKYKSQDEALKAKDKLKSEKNVDALLKQ
jgi:cell division septation protein DedD/CheY-like chemotaxis protein